MCALCDDVAPVIGLTVGQVSVAVETAAPILRSLCARKDPGHGRELTGCSALFGRERMLAALPAATGAAALCCIGIVKGTEHERWRSRRFRRIAYRHNHSCPQVRLRGRTT